MQLDIGEVRFLTKVAQKSPRGLRLLLFKSKASGNEKLVFIVKTASEDIDKLALSKMTWQTEQSKLAPRIAIVRLLILPEGSDEFFQSESGLLMNEDKDRRSVEALGRQKSVEIFFFNYEADFHSKIELMTTYNMSQTAKALMELNPIIDEGKLIVKSENLSENDIKNAITGKVKDSPLKDKDLLDSIQKKMPVISSSIPKTKPVEVTKTSIKSNDMAVSGTYGNTTPKPQENKQNEIRSEDLKKISEKPAAKITTDDLMKSMPPGKFSAADLMKSIPPGKIKSEDIFAQALNNPLNESKSSLSVEDLLKVVDNDQSGNLSSEQLLKSIPPDSLTTEELLKSLNNSTIPAEAGLKAQDLLQSLIIDDPLSNMGLNSQDLLQSLASADSTINLKGGLNTEDLLRSLKGSMEPLKHPETGLDKESLLRTFQEDDESSFIDSAPTAQIKHSRTQELKKDDLFDALKSEPSPLKLSPEEESQLVSDLMSEPTPLKVAGGGESELMKEMGKNFKTPVSAPEPGYKDVSITEPEKKEEASSISEADLLKILNGEM